MTLAKANHCHSWRDCWRQLGALCWLLLLSLGVLADADRATLRVGFFSLAPHAFLDVDKRPTGAAVDYMQQYLAPHMKVQIDWQHLPFTRLLYMLDNERIDAVLVLAKNPGREEKYLYPAQPFAAMQSGLVVSTNSHLESIHRVDQLYGTKIGFTKGGYLSPFMQDSSITFQYVVGDSHIFQTLLKQLDAGRVDAVYNPTMESLIFEARELGLQERVRFLALPEPEVALYTVFSKRAEQWRERYEEAQKKQQEGRYRLLLDAYLLEP